MGETITQQCRIEFDTTGVERETSISFFIEQALDDPSATVYSVETDEEVTDIEQVTEVAA